MIIMDASPLIYLAKANCLHLLLHFAKRIFLSDEVYHECAGRWFAPYPVTVGPPDDALVIARFVEQNREKLIITETQLGVQLKADRLQGQKINIQGAGEMSARSLFDRRRELTGGRSPVLVIFEDTQVPVRFAGSDVHLLSTFALLVAMEKAGYIASAQAVFDTISEGFRPSGTPLDESISSDTTYSEALPPAP